MKRAALGGLSRAIKLPISTRSRSACSLKRRSATPQPVANRAFSRAKTSLPLLVRPAARSSIPACRSRCNAASLSASVSAGSTVRAKRASAGGGSGKRSSTRFGSSDAATTIVNGSRVFAGLDGMPGFSKIDPNTYTHCRLNTTGRPTKPRRSTPPAGASRGRLPPSRERMSACAGSRPRRSTRRSRTKG